MFGHVDYTIQTAPGQGIVSSAVLQSDCLDEIDWEWLGGDDTQGQSNYFGKGLTTAYNRGAFHDNPGNHDGFHTYSVDWTADAIVWSLDGQPLRTLTPQTADAGQYPQTPMVIKVGAWAGGDSANPAGTISWAGGLTDYTKGPYTMYLKSMHVADYSTGTEYTYSGSSGTWESIKSSGGQINSNGQDTPGTTLAPGITSTVTQAGQPTPFAGSLSGTAATTVGATTSAPTSTFTHPSVYPWVPSSTGSTMATAASVTTSISGLPSGWTINSSGKAVPPPNAGLALSAPIVAVACMLGAVLTLVLP